VASRRIGVLGATSLVGMPLLSLLSRNGFEVAAFSRRSCGLLPEMEGVEWLQLDAGINPIMSESIVVKSLTQNTKLNKIDAWVSVAPIWVLQNYFGLFTSCGIKRIVAVSSTSLFIKGESSDPHEQEVASSLLEGEQQLITWANDNGVQWIILRPTLIYGNGRDKNISEIANFIRRFGFFPIFGQACGLRQPVHADDVATACLDALQGGSPVVNHAYNLSGGETLTYRAMVVRVFSALGLRPRLVKIPLWIFGLSISLLHLVPRYRHWTTAMAQRMNQDLFFDHSQASHDFGYSPRIFNPFGEAGIGQKEQDL
jgi:nucleoside-diphosphate-sugar epimerase